MGELLSRGHTCNPPSASSLQYGALYRCECGVLYVLQSGDRWYGCTPIEEALVLLNHRIAEAKRQRRGV